MSLHVLFILVFGLFVSFKLNWVPCLLFGGHVNFGTSMFMNHHVGYLSICLIYDRCALLVVGDFVLSPPISFKKLFLMGTFMHTH